MKNRQDRSKGIFGRVHNIWQGNIAEETVYTFESFNSKDLKTFYFIF